MYVRCSIYVAFTVGLVISGQNFSESNERTNMEKLYLMLEMIQKNEKKLFYINLYMTREFDLHEEIGEEINVFELKQNQKIMK